ncbi:hypothetical protein [Comamonas odontotermitis]|uniref:hypothetical protein n=1 Tax=Comamonas odontotermitis TaxID=379895 RepID=UPI001CC82DC0|nr:hypothetical protein [Comamonas odontotermitis]UBB18326.1 hypothetical protein LAD35_06725 [Comamonas odontotermitis]
MTSEKLKPTPGPWIADDNEGFSPWTIWSRMTPSGNGAPGPVIARIEGDSAEADDSATLIAEAGTVFHECGLSPRELLEGYRELRKTLQDLEASYQFLKPAGHQDSDTQKSARAALATYKEV